MKKLFTLITLTFFCMSLLTSFTSAQEVNIPAKVSVQSRFDPQDAMKKTSVCANGHLEAIVFDHGASVRTGPSLDAQVEMRLAEGTNLWLDGYVTGETVKGTNKWYYFNTFMGFRYIHASELKNTNCATAE
ncbi:hypothetical protein [Laceyella putida]|uniref:SH3 domain-containing protein n=1 Tax=Laceyella putida TaxID=110101 RepID=A0ABW2RHH8_9BACL